MRGEGKELAEVASADCIKERRGDIGCEVRGGESTVTTCGGVLPSTMASLAFLLGASSAFLLGASSAFLLASSSAFLLGAPSA